MTFARNPVHAALLALCATGLASHALADDFLDSAKKKIAVATMTKE